MRQDTPVIYRNDESFPIGGSKLLRHTSSDRSPSSPQARPSMRRWKRTIACSATAFRSRHRCLLHQAIDAAALREAADATGAIVTVEDHYPAGGLGDAVLQALADRPVPVTILAVRKTPMSGSGDELRDFEGISASAIVEAVKRAIAIDAPV